MNFGESNLFKFPKISRAVKQLRDLKVGYMPRICVTAIGRSRHRRGGGGGAKNGRTMARKKLGRFDFFAE